MKWFKWVLELKTIRSENNLRFQNKGNLWSICKYNWDTLGWPKLLGNDDIDLRIDINHTDTSCVPKNKDTTKRNETNRSDQLKEKLFIMQEIYHKPAIIFRFLYHYFFFLNLNFLLRLLLHAIERCSCRLTYCITSGDSFLPYFFLFSS